MARTVLAHAPRQARVTLLERALEPHEHLAAAVLEQAVVDAGDHTLPTAKRRQAAAFLLRDRHGLPFWAAVAGLNVATIRQRARHAIPPDLL